MTTLARTWEATTIHSMTLSALTNRLLWPDTGQVLGTPRSRLGLRSRFPFTLLSTVLPGRCLGARVQRRPSRPTEFP